MPATCATVRTSPFEALFSATRAKGVAPRSTLAEALAMRRLCRLYPTSTIDARPFLSTCVRDAAPAADALVPSSEGSAFPASRGLDSPIMAPAQASTLPHSGTALEGLRILRGTSKTASSSLLASFLWGCGAVLVQCRGLRNSDNDNVDRVACAGAETETGTPRADFDRHDAHDRIASIALADQGRTHRTDAGGRGF